MNRSSEEWKDWSDHKGNILTFLPEPKIKISKKNTSICPSKDILFKAPVNDVINHSYWFCVLHTSAKAAMIVALGTDGILRVRYKDKPILPLLLDLPLLKIIANNYSNTDTKTLKIKKLNLLKLQITEAYYSSFSDRKIIEKIYGTG